MNNTILAVINSWPHATYILHRARQVADAVGGTVVVYCPVSSELDELNRYIGFDNYESLRDELVADSRARLDELPGIEGLDAEVEWHAKPYRAVADKAESLSSSLIVMAVSEHSVLGDFLHKPDDWHLLRDAHCPVMILGREEQSYRGVAVAVDVLDASEDHQALNGRILDEGKMMAEALHLPLHVVSVVPDPAYVYSDVSATDSVVMADFRNEARDLAAARQVKLLERFGIQAHRHVVEVGIVEKVLQETLSREGLLVIGTIANKGVKGFFLGNTAERLLQRLKGDMLVVN